MNATKPVFYVDAAPSWDSISSSIDDLEGDVIVEAPTFVEKCTKCGGTGVWKSYSGMTHRTCYACKGVGSFTRKTSPEARAKAKVSRESKTLRDQTDNWEFFSAAHMEITQWVVASAPTFEFAAAMKEAITKYGNLTDGQFAAVEKCMARKAAAVAAKAERAENAPEVNVNKIAESFAAAHAAGLKTPKIRLAGFIFSRAPDTGRNAGSIYCKDSDTDTYLGKVTDGKFFASRDCTKEQEVTVLEVASNPEAAAVAYGRRTGQCSCCGRELTVGESIDRGIGPICAAKFGW